ncbi:MAG: VanZ family protein [Blastocatellia bacterium]|nr:VanZ family protein [Blastocatellia bacterium]
MDESKVKPISHANWWRFLTLILWICVILYSSTGNASMAKTSRFLRPLLEFIFSSEDTIYWANVIIRKSAHLVYYAILAGAAAFAFVGSPIDWLKRNWFWASFGIVFLIASIDEINQSLNPTRSGLFSDVILDCVGGLVMLSLFYLFLRIKQNRG